MSENIDNNETAPEEKLDFQRILPIFVIVLVDLMGLTIIIPLLPLYAASYGASPAMIGALGATYPLLQFAAAPVLGRLSDRYGRKPVLVISQIGTSPGEFEIYLNRCRSCMCLSTFNDSRSFWDSNYVTGDILFFTELQVGC